MEKKKLWGKTKIIFGCTIPLKRHHWQVNILKFWSRHFSYSRSVLLFSLLINQNILLLSFSLPFLLRLSPYLEGTFDGEILPFHRVRERQNTCPHCFDHRKHARCLLRTADTWRRERERCIMAQILLWLPSIADAWQGGPFWNTHRHTHPCVCVCIRPAPETLS